LFDLGSVSLKICVSSLLPCAALAAREARAVHANKGRLRYGKQNLVSGFIALPPSPAHSSGLLVVFVCFFLFAQFDTPNRLVPGQGVFSGVPAVTLPGVPDNVRLFNSPSVPFSFARPQQEQQQQPARPFQSQQQQPPLRLQTHMPMTPNIRLRPADSSSNTLG
jgi:hypothetical protein